MERDRLLLQDPTRGPPYPMQKTIKPRHKTNSNNLKELESERKLIGWWGAGACMFSWKKGNFANKFPSSRFCSTIQWWYNSKGTCGKTQSFCLWEWKKQIWGAINTKESRGIPKGKRQKRDPQTLSIHISNWCTELIQSRHLNTTYLNADWSCCPRNSLQSKPSQENDLLKTKDITFNREKQHNPESPAT